MRIALAGNPNCGKTTMFNALTGANQYVGNWPGVTVEKKEGRIKGKDITVTDLPGIYSLSPYTLEETVSRKYLVSERPDVIIDLVDATNIERNLYLTTQLLEIGIPVVIALNMSDLLEKKGLRIDEAKLASALGCPVVKASTLKKQGLEEVINTAMKLSIDGCVQKSAAVFPADIEKRVVAIENAIGGISSRWYAVKALENDSAALEGFSIPADAGKSIEDLRSELEEALDDDIESIVTDYRYKYIQKVVEKCVKKPKEKLTLSDKIDKVVTNRILGLPIFVLVMFVVYYISVTTIGTLVTDWTNDVFVGGIQEAVGGWLSGVGVSDVIVSLFVDGVIGGVGAVIGFVPQMAILFLFLSFLEDCGYMVRIAFVMDRVFRHFGLSGKSFIPLLISSGCGVPGIMASKTIDNDNDRRLTIMTATFIPCGAKLPVIALMGGVMAGYASGSYEAAGVVAPLMYFIGIIAVLVSAIMLKKTKPFSGKPSPFVMELPEYHVPSPKTLLIHVWQRVKGFLIKAGTIIFVVSVVMWFLSSFGFSDGFGLVEDSADSILAAIGNAIAPLFIPLGFGSWQPVASLLSGFAAKEAIVSTMGVLANVQGDVEDAVLVAESIAAWFPTAVAAFSFLIFNLLNSPCFAAIGTMAEQMHSRKWFWFAILYQNAFAYCVSLMVYQFGKLIVLGSFGAGTVAAFIVLAFMLYMLVRKDPYHDKIARRSVEVA